MRVHLAFTAAICFVILLGAVFAVDDASDPKSAKDQLKQAELEAVERLIALEKKKLELLQQIKSDPAAVVEDVTTVDSAQPSRVCEGGVCEAQREASLKESKPGKDILIDEPSSTPGTDNENLDVLVSETMHMSPAVNPQWPKSSVSMITLALRLPRRRQRGKQKRRARVAHVVAIATNAQELQFFDLQGRLLHSLQTSHTQSITTLTKTPTPKGCFIATGSEDGEVRVYHVDAYTEVSPEDPADVIVNIRVEPRLVLPRFDTTSAARYGTEYMPGVATIEDSKGGDDSAHASASVAAVTCVSVLHQRRKEKYVVGYSNGYIRVFDAKGQARKDIKVTNSSVTGLASNGGLVTFAASDSFGTLRPAAAKRIMSLSCPISNVTTDTSSVVVNPQKRGWTYIAEATTGTIHCFYIYHRRKPQRCSPVHSFVVEPKQHLQLAVMSGYLLATTSSSLYVFNISGSQHNDPTFVHKQRLTKHETDPSRPVALDVAEALHRTDDTYFVVTSSDGVTTSFLSYLPPETPFNSKFGQFRMPMFVAAMLIVVVYQFCRRSRKGNDEKQIENILKEGALSRFRQAGGTDDPLAKFKASPGFESAPRIGGSRDRAREREADEYFSNQRGSRSGGRFGQTSRGFRDTGHGLSFD